MRRLGTVLIVLSARTSGGFDCNGNAEGSLESPEESAIPGHGSAPILRAEWASGAQATSERG